MANVNQANNKMSPLPDELYRQHLPTAAVQNTAGCEKSTNLFLGKKTKILNLNFKKMTPVVRNIFVYEIPNEKDNVSCNYEVNTFIQHGKCLGNC